MNGRNIFRTLLIGGVVMVMTQTSFAQTADELKAERAQIQAELKSKDTQKREEKLDKLAAEKAPGETGLQSVDGLAKTAEGILGTVASANTMLAKFKRTVKDDGEGNIDITEEKAHLDDYLALAAKLPGCVDQIADGSKKLADAQKDAKSLSPMKARPALKSISYSTDALKLSGEEVALQIKLVKNLIATIKSSGNL